MIGSAILAGLLAALFFAVITGRLRLPDEDYRPRHLAPPVDVTNTTTGEVVATFDTTREAGGWAQRQVFPTSWGPRRETPRHVRLHAAPFDWSRHVGL